MIRICSLWGSENHQWRNANWTWTECEMVQEICAVWSTTKFPWGLALWKWNECSGSIVPPTGCAVWSTTGVLWSKADWKWNECSSSKPIPVISVGNPPGVDAMTLVQPWLEEPWNPYRTSSLDKQKRLIKLVCKVKGQNYDETKEVKDFPVTVGDIRMVVKAVADIDLALKLEE